MDLRDALVNNLYGNRKRALVAVEFISSPRTLVSRWVSRSIGHVVVVWHRQDFYGRATFLSAACFSKPFTDYFMSSDLKIWIEYLCSGNTVSPTPLLVLFLELNANLSNQLGLVYHCMWGWVCQKVCSVCCNFTIIIDQVHLWNWIRKSWLLRIFV